MRRQNEVIIELIHQGVDAIAISPIQSMFLSKRSLKLTKQKCIPIVIFDSELSPQATVNVQPFAYVGSNNYDLGVLLGKSVLSHAVVSSGNLKHFLIITGRRDSTNLSLRIKGVQDVLTEKNSKSQNLVELREPIYSFGRVDNINMQLEKIINDYQHQLDAIISTGGRAQFGTEGYQRAISGAKEIIQSKRLLIVSADTTEPQIKLIEKDVSHINIGQSPF